MNTESKTEESMNDKPQHMNRRDVIKTLGVAASGVAAGVVPAAEAAHGQQTSGAVGQRVFSHSAKEHS